MPARRPREGEGGGDFVASEQIWSAPSLLLWAWPCDAVLSTDEMAARADRAAMDIQVANNAELRANAQRILASTRAARPRNTSLAYEPKQDEFRVSWPAR
ncbi:hypothetical protein BDV96DRAFT_186112 [Lophiotrema nucula]|uniref:Uncharacterized protein n=1 Tax=Lophiotrema nucula TaxID=690887 RepID=A0A6A5YWU0_9PLEO|nr:hypothetical protein BDV96DRAFT_186112 [Lophiotrema nucula]